MIRLLLSVTHFCARRRTFARPSKPIASHSGCALRARAASALTSSADMAGTVVITSPVAGFSTGMPAAPFVDAAAGLDSTVAIDSPSLGRSFQAYPMLAGQPVGGRRENPTRGVAPLS